MQIYIGTKTILAEPMSKGEYNIYRGWELPADEDGSDEGMLIEYTNGGKANHPDHKGYISWSPIDVFNRAYKSKDVMNFSDALHLIKSGIKVQRREWNGNGMFVFLVPGSTFAVNRPPLLGIYPEGTVINYCAHIDLKTADGSVCTWVPSTTDVLADDWVVVD